METVDLIVLAELVLKVLSGLENDYLSSIAQGENLTISINVDKGACKVVVMTIMSLLVDKLNKSIVNFKRNEIEVNISAVRRPLCSQQV